MGAVATETPRLEARQLTGRSAQRLFEPSGSTLEDRILGVWEDLTAGGPAECPVCRSRMRMASGCEGCGSDLS